MTQEISIHKVDRNFLRAELRHVVEYFRNLGHRDCELVFGWHWAMDYPPGSPWKPMHMPLEEVESEVRKPEEANLGALGRDDVTIRVPPVDDEFCFCHHGGIHLTFSQPSAISMAFHQRWTLAGLTPMLRDCEASV